MSQETGYDVLFIDLFKRRLIDWYTQNWNSDVHDNERSLYYKEYKINLEFESYLKIVETRKHLEFLAKIRCVSYKLEIDLS